MVVFFSVLVASRAPLANLSCNILVTCLRRSVILSHFKANNLLCHRNLLPALNQNVERTLRIHGALFSFKGLPRINVFDFRVFNANKRYFLLKHLLNMNKRQSLESTY